MSRDRVRSYLGGVQRAEESRGENLLEGSRWLPVKWLRKDWRRRLNASRTRYQGVVLEVLEVDPRLQLAFVRVAVVEETPENTGDPGVQWKLDAWGRRFAVPRTTRAIVMETVGPLSLSGAQKDEDVHAQLEAGGHWHHMIVEPVEPLPRPGKPRKKQRVRVSDKIHRERNRVEDKMIQAVDARSRAYKAG